MRHNSGPCSCWAGVSTGCSWGGSGSSACLSAPSRPACQGGLAAVPRDVRTGRDVHVSSALGNQTSASWTALLVAFPTSLSGSLRFWMFLPRPPARVWGLLMAPRLPAPHGTRSGFSGAGRGPQSTVGCPAPQPGSSFVQGRLCMRPGAPASFGFSLTPERGAVKKQEDKRTVVFSCRISNSALVFLFPGGEVRVRGREVQRRGAAEQPAGGDEGHAGPVLSGRGLAGTGRPCWPGEVTRRVDVSCPHFYFDSLHSLGRSAEAAPLGQGLC